eukprot:1148515-Pelagomonas_calceolata.AAC.5
MNDGCGNVCDCENDGCCTHAIVNLAFDRWGECRCVSCGYQNYGSCNRQMLEDGACVIGYVCMTLCEWECVHLNGACVELGMLAWECVHEMCGNGKVCT